MYHQGHIKESSFMRVITTFRMSHTSSDSGLLRRCVPTEEGINIIERCHSSPYRGHYGAFCTDAKI
jgi:hypothetical protein